MWKDGLWSVDLFRSNRYSCAATGHGGDDVFTRRIIGFGG